LLQAAREAAGHQRFERAALYVVATPIGNLADLTLRAIFVLSEVDAWACEDTRVSAQLMRYLGLDKPMLAAHEHNEQQAAQQVLARLAEGQSVALVSDAGTPAISDPGARLVARVREAGYGVVPLPGASAVLAAMSVAGDETTGPFTFHGFLPSKGAARREALMQITASASAQVLFEAPHRIEGLLAALAESVPQRPLTLCRELTKQFETVHRCQAADAPAWLAADAQRRRGEFVLVLHAMPAAALEAELDAGALRALQLLMAELPLKQAVALTAQLTGAPRNALYAHALAGQVPADADDQWGADAAR
jgi:16S rRNA (cytidine1402-2'-O)-methyltransferase